MPPAAPSGVICTATRIDLDRLVALENACFSLDAQSRRSLAYLLTRAHADTRVVDDDDALAAYAMLLYRRGSRVARLYSIAVAPAARGRGLAARLLVDAQAIAARRGCALLRAEARLGNRASRALFAAAGFIETDRLPGYYPGGEDGVRLEGPLDGSMRPSPPRSA